LCITRDEMGSTPNLARYFTNFVSFKQVQNVLGSFKFCTVKLEPTFDQTKENDSNEKSQKQDKGGKQKQEKKEKKKEEPKKSDKEEKERLRQEALEKELKEHDNKVKAWLEMECKFDFEEFKRV